MPLRNFRCCFKTSANRRSHLKGYSKAFFLCKSGGWKAGGYHQYTSTSGSFFESFIPFDELSIPVLIPIFSAIGCHFLFRIDLLIGFEKQMSGTFSNCSRIQEVIICIQSYQFPGAKHSCVTSGLMAKRVSLIPATIRSCNACNMAEPSTREVE